MLNNTCLILAMKENLAFQFLNCKKYLDDVHNFIV